MNSINHPNTSGRPAVFLDRDGVINREIGFLTRKEDFELLPGSAEAIHRLNASGFLVVVVTNQSVISHGWLSETGLGDIHAQMISLLAEKKAHVDRIYHCPHASGLDTRFPRGADESLPCACHKPGTGMLEQASAELGIDFRKSWLIGDRSGDILAATKAGIRSILVRTGAAGQDHLYPATPDYMADDLAAASTFILDEYPLKLQTVSSYLEDVRPGDTVLIGGLARSGKSILASLMRDALLERGFSVKKISLDCFLRPLGSRGETVLERYDMDSITRFAEKISQRPVSMALPHYEPGVRTIFPDAVHLDLIPEDVLVIEGVVALTSAGLRSTAKKLFYLDCPPETRKKRFAVDYTLRGEGETWISLFEKREMEERPLIEKGKKYGQILSQNYG